ncbi:hypothetical protein MYBA111488_09260 [Mycobacterium basiliense]
MADGATRDCSGINQRQSHRGLREFVRGCGVNEFASVLGQTRGKNRIGRRQRVDRNVVVGKIEGRAPGQMF